jgi:hypothetical protein
MANMRLENGNRRKPNLIENHNILDELTLTIPIGGGFESDRTFMKRRSTSASEPRITDIERPAVGRTG